MRKFTQTVLDFGQKTPGTKVCPLCQMPFAPCSGEDRKFHRSYHIVHLKGLRFKPKSRNRHVSSVYKNGSDEIIKISLRRQLERLKSDPLGSKVLDLFQVIKTDLSFSLDSLFTGESVLFVFTKRGRAVGACVAREIETARPLVFAPDGVFVRKKLVPASLGIQMVWILRAFRRQNMASSLLDVVRKNFLGDREVGKFETAIRSPSTQGLAFAKEYFSGRKLLVY